MTLQVTAWASTTTHQWDLPPHRQLVHRAMQWWRFPLGQTWTSRWFILSVQYSKKSESVSFLHHTEQSAATEHMLWHHSACIHDRWWWHGQSLLCAVRRWKKVKTAYLKKSPVFTCWSCPFRLDMIQRILQRNCVQTDTRCLSWRYEKHGARIACTVFKMRRTVQVPFFVTFLHPNLASQ
jgi:hypothetical protein